MRITIKPQVEIIGTDTEPKKIKTSFGENEIKVQRNRYSSFNPILVPKRGNIAQGLENVIISLYAKGLRLATLRNKSRKYMILKSLLQQYQE